MTSTVRRGNIPTPPRTRENSLSHLPARFSLTPIPPPPLDILFPASARETSHIEVFAHVFDSKGNEAPASQTPAISRPLLPVGAVPLFGGGQIVGSDDQPIAHLVTSGTAEVRLHSHNIDEIGNGMAAWRELYGALLRHTIC